MFPLISSFKLIFSCLSFYLAADKDNNVFIFDYHECVLRRVDASTGIINIIAGFSGHGTCGDGSLATGAALSVALNQNKNVDQGLAVDVTGTSLFYIMKLNSRFC